MKDYQSIAALADRLILSADDPEFKEMLERSGDIAKLKTADEFRDDLIERIFNQPKLIGPSMRLSKLEDKLRFPPGQVTVWFGPNGHGKSLVTSQCALDLAFLEEPPLIFSFEMAPLATVHRMVKQSAGTDSVTRAWVEAFLEWAHQRIWIFDQRGQAAGPRILDLALYAAEKVGVKHIFIDSLMKCVKGEEDYDGQKDFIDRCCQLALAANVHVHVVHHVKKGPDENSYPRKFDAKGSGSISDQVDCMVGVWRNKRKEEKRRRKDPGFDENDPDAVLVIDKNRHIEWEGTVGLHYIPGAQSYTELPGRPLVYPLQSYMRGVPT